MVNLAKLPIISIVLWLKQFGLQSLIKIFRTVTTLEAPVEQQGLKSHDI